MKSETGTAFKSSLSRDSGLGWIGEIPEHWEVRPIRSLAKSGYRTFTDGDWIELPFIRDSGIRLIQTGNIGIGRYIDQGFRFIDDETFATLHCTEVFPGDVLICRLADPVGRACLAPNLGSRMITSVDVCILKPAPDIHPGFLVYALSSAGYLSWLGAICRGGTRDRVSRSMLGSIRIQIPPIEEQRAISAYLDRETVRIDDLIERKERQITLLQERRAAFISNVVIRGLDRNAPMRSSGIQWLGETPKHWRVLRAKYLFREIDERSTTGDEELLTVSHITGVTPRSEKDVTMFMAESLEDYKKCNPNDLVINTMWAWMGALGVAPCAGIVSPSYNVYRFRSDATEPRYYDHLLRTPMFTAAIRCQSKGIWTSRLRLYPEEFFDIRLPCPPLDEQQAIVTAIETETGNYEALQEKIDKSINLLREYRTALISAAVTGKRDIREEVPA